MKRVLAVVLVLGVSAWCLSMSVMQRETEDVGECTCVAASYEASRTSLYIDTGGTLAVGYADFNGDGREDVLKAYVNGSTHTTPVRMFLQQADGSLVEDSSLLPEVVPGTVHARKVVVADFNGDGTPDAFIADHGYDRAPFRGAQPVLLMSSEGRFVQRVIPGVPTGFQHSACAGDLTGDGTIDIFVTDTTNGAFLLVNDGRGEFTVTRDGIPGLSLGYYTSEIIDIDDDGCCDLVVAGHEHEGASTCVYWGNASHRYGIEQRSVVPQDQEYPIVVDIDAEDLDGDGLREIVLTRTRSNPFYGSYCFQIIAQENRRLEEASQSIAPDASGQSERLFAWIPWIELRDFNGDGYRDIVVPDSGRSFVLLNDGRDLFTRMR